MTEYHEFRVTVDGEVMAEVSGPDRQRALSEAMHYLMIYRNDGNAQIEGVEQEDFDALQAPSGWKKVTVK
jgi:hypothetical protein